jgi:hypothetical protein
MKSIEEMTLNIKKILKKRNLSIDLESCTDNSIVDTSEVFKLVPEGVDNVKSVLKRHASKSNLAAIDATEPHTLKSEVFSVIDTITILLGMPGNANLKVNQFLSVYLKSHGLSFDESHIDKITVTDIRNYLVHKFHLHHDEVVDEDFKDGVKALSNILICFFELEKEAKELELDITEGDGNVSVKPETLMKIISGILDVAESRIKFSEIKSSLGIQHKNSTIVEFYREEYCNLQQSIAFGNSFSKEPAKKFFGSAIESLQMAPEEKESKENDEINKIEAQKKLIKNNESNFWKKTVDSMQEKLLSMPMEDRPRQDDYAMILLSDENIKGFNEDCDAYVSGEESMFAFLDTKDYNPLKNLVEKKPIKGATIRQLESDNNYSIGGLKKILEKLMVEKIKLHSVTGKLSDEDISAIIDLYVSFQAAIHSMDIQDLLGENDFIIKVFIDSKSLKSFFQKMPKSSDFFVKLNNKMNDESLFLSYDFLNELSLAKRSVDSKEVINKEIKALEGKLAVHNKIKKLRSAIPFLDEEKDTALNLLFSKNPKKRVYDLGDIKGINGFAKGTAAEYRVKMLSFAPIKEVLDFSEGDLDAAMKGRKKISQSVILFAQAFEKNRAEFQCLMPNFDEIDKKVVFLNSLVSGMSERFAKYFAGKDIAILLAQANITHEDFCKSYIIPSIGRLSAGDVASIHVIKYMADAVSLYEETNSVPVENRFSNIVTEHMLKELARIAVLNDFLLDNARKVLDGRESVDKLMGFTQEDLSHSFVYSAMNASLREIRNFYLIFKNDDIENKIKNLSVEMGFLYEYLNNKYEVSDTQLCDIFLKHISSHQSDFAKNTVATIRHPRPDANYDEKAVKTPIKASIGLTLDMPVDQGVVTRLITRQYMSMCKKAESEKSPLYKNKDAYPKHSDDVALDIKRQNSCLLM